MKTEKQRKLIVRIGAAILAGLMILSALSAVLFRFASRDFGRADDPLGTFRRTIQLKGHFQLKNRSCSPTALRANVL